MKTSEIKSPQTVVNASLSRVYAFLSNFSNFGGLMPDQITNWKATENDCSFTIQGMGDLGLRIAEKIPESRITILPMMDKPLPFTFQLICRLAPLPDEKTDALISIDAEMPPMISMMAGRPLQNLVNILAQRLQEHFAGQALK